MLFSSRFRPARADLCRFPIRIALVLTIGGAMGSAPGASQSRATPSPPNPPAGYQAYVARLGDRAVAEGVRRSTVDRELATVTYSQRAVALDRKEAGGSAAASPSTTLSNFAPYRRSHVEPVRINRGRRHYQQLRPFLARVERETGVPESIMVSIWGNETSYGAVRGGFDLPSALASLAYDGRRRALFEPEFIASLKIIDRGVPRYKLKGSWAGATGHPQFLPSVYLRLARDGDGDGVIDIWESPADALASIGNYFAEAGWQNGLPWGVAVQVPGGLNRAALASPLVSPRCPRVHARRSRWQTMAEWRMMGVTPTGRTMPDTTLAALIEPDGPGKTAYLVTGNYTVILDYNCSNFYALAVGLLADEVSR